MPFRRLPGMYFPDPWRRLATDWPRVSVRPLQNPGPRYGLTRWEPGGPVIYLHPELRQVQARAVLAHEIEHLERGAPCESLRASIEQRVVTATARWLLPDVEAIAAAMVAYGDDLYRVAHEMWVPKKILLDRIHAFDEHEWLVIEKRREAAT